MSQQSPKSTTSMTSQAASRIQSAEARAGGGQTAKGSFSARAASAAAKGGGGKK